MSKIVGIAFSNNEMFSLNVEYAISVLKKSGDFSFYQIDYNNIVDNIEQIICGDTQIVVFFVSYHSYDFLVEYSQKIKNVLSNCFIIVCHQVATKFAEELLKNIPEIDIVVLGEFEGTLGELTERILLGKDFKCCQGIAYIENGKYIVTSQRPLLDIESIAYPTRKALADNTRYFYVCGSRGCEGNCTFCDRNYLYKAGNELQPRYRSIGDIVNEIDLLVKKGNCKFVSFTDATFCSNENINDRLEELYCLLKQKKYWVQFSFCLRSEQISDKVVLQLKKLKEVGLGKVFIGIESFNDSDLKLYGKRSDVDTNIKTIKKLKNIEYDNGYFLRIGYGFINFNPYSTLEGLKNNLNMLQQLGLGINPYIVLTKVSLNAMTPLTKKVNADNLFHKKIEDYSMKELMERRYPYHFKNEDVQEVFEILSYCVSNLNYKNINGTEFIRNRYFHFYGYDNIVENIDLTYKMWIEEVNRLTEGLFGFIVFTKLSSEEKRKIVMEKCELFNKQFNFIDSRMMRIQRRAMIQLEKIDELIYNRLR